MCPFLHFGFLCFSKRRKGCIRVISNTWSLLERKHEVRVEWPAAQVGRITMESRCRACNTRRWRTPSAKRKFPTILHSVNIHSVTAGWQWRHALSSDHSRSSLRCARFFPLASYAPLREYGGASEWYLTPSQFLEENTMQWPNGPRRNLDVLLWRRDVVHMTLNKSRPDAEQFAVGGRLPQNTGFPRCSKLLVLYDDPCSRLRQKCARCDERRDTR